MKVSSYISAKSVTAKTPKELERSLFDIGQEQNTSLKIITIYQDAKSLEHIAWFYYDFERNLSYDLDENKG